MGNDRIIHGIHSECGGLASVPRMLRDHTYECHDGSKALGSMLLMYYVLASTWTSAKRSINL